MPMTDDNCSDCGLAHLLHIREDGIYGCPPTMSVSGRDCHDVFSEYADSSMRSDSPDPLLLAPDKQLPQRRYLTLRRSAQPEGVVVPMRRTTHLEDRRRTRENTVPYARAETYRQARRSSHRMAEDPVFVQRSRPRGVSQQDCRSRRYSAGASTGRSHENAAVFPAQKDSHDYPPRRKSLQPHVLKRMVPVEDMEPIEGFRPFTELDSGQLPVPVTTREPMRDLVRPPFQFVWKPSVVIPAVGGMRVRVGQFERRDPLGDGMPFPSCNVAHAHENETGSESSGSEGYFTAYDWSSSFNSQHNPWDHGGPSVNTLQTATPLKPYYPPQPEFIQGSSKSIPSLQQEQQSLVDGPGDTHPPSVGDEFSQFEALAQHYADVQNQGKSLAPLPRVPPPHHAMGSAPSASIIASCSRHHPEAVAPPCPQRRSSSVTSTRDRFTPTPMPMPTTPQPSENPQSHTAPKAPRRSSMPGTLPGLTLTSTDTDTDTDTDMDIPDRGETEAAVDAIEDWATREPWEYIHHVLTHSTCPLVMFLKTPTGDLPTAALGALGADLRLQKMLVDNEHWLLIGAPDLDDVDLFKFGVRFQSRAGLPDKFVFRFGNLNWGADVNQIEDEVFKAAMERSRRGRGVPATLPAQFMAGALGGFVVWYALSLM